MSCCISHLRYIQDQLQIIKIECCSHNLLDILQTVNQSLNGSYIPTDSYREECCIVISITLPIFSVLK